MPEKKKEEKKTLGKVNNKVEINPDLKTSVEEELIQEFETLDEEDMAIIDEFLEDLSVATRNKKKIIMKRLKSRIKIARKRSMKRRANTSTLEKRARKSAIDSVKKKFNPKYKSSSASEKSRVERMAARRKAIIDRITKKTVKDKRKADIKRLSSSEVFSGNELIETLDTLYDSLNK